MSRLCVRDYQVHQMAKSAASVLERYHGKPGRCEIWLDGNPVKTLAMKTLK